MSLQKEAHAKKKGRHSLVFTFFVVKGFTLCEYLIRLPLTPWIITEKKQQKNYISCKRYSEINAQALVATDVTKLDTGSACEHGIDNFDSTTEQTCQTVTVETTSVVESVPLEELVRQTILSEA